MKRYFITEEFRVGTIPSSANPYIPTIVTGYGKCSLEKEANILLNTEWPCLSEVRVKHFDSNKEYNQYIRKMQELGVRIEYIKVKQ